MAAVLRVISFLLRLHQPHCLNYNNFRIKANVSFRMFNSGLFSLLLRFYSHPLYPTQDQGITEYEKNSLLGLTFISEPKCLYVSQCFLVFVCTVDCGLCVTYSFSCNSFHFLSLPLSLIFLNLTL